MSTVNDDPDDLIEVTRGPIWYDVPFAVYGDLAQRCAAEVTHQDYGSIAMRTMGVFGAHVCYRFTKPESVTMFVLRYGTEKERTEDLSPGSFWRKVDRR